MILSVRQTRRFREAVRAVLVVIVALVMILATQFVPAVVIVLPFFRSGNHHQHLSHELRITTVYVTHDQIEAMTPADRVAVMNHGRIQQLGTPEEIYDDPRNLFVAGFIGSPAMNLIEGATDAGRFETEGASIAAVGGGTRDGVVLGVRPEDLSIADPGEGSFDAEVYASELTGESVLVTVEIADRRIAAKAGRHTRKAIGETVGIRVDPVHTYLFDAATGDRIAR